MNNIQALAELQERRKGIATTHNGVRYRSRLEARWAEFFRLLGWRAFYEPFDLDGYIPDFILHGHKQQILVEVKPVSGMDDPLVKEAAAKIERSGWEHDALIVSYFLPKFIHDEITQIGLLCIGWIREADDKVFVQAPFQTARPSTHRPKVGFCGDKNSVDRITNYQPPIGYGHDSNPLGKVDWKYIETLWANAGNAVQWRAP
jgi:hypothetical protein